ncbi:hypothetical protein HWV62_13982 [Athelia sp. TMB]|nr:hypothetical protein HWV62_13982 [Athelia sp. TMB]
MRDASKLAAIDAAFHPGNDEGDSIPLSSIPDALASLNIPVDDDVLQVFNNAASGWSAPADSASTSTANGATVNRKDFRAVCAVLLDIEDEEDLEGDPEALHADSGGGFLIEDDTAADTGGGFLLPSDQEEEDYEEEEDAYESEPASEDVSDSAGEFTNEQPSTRRTRTRTRHRSSSASSSSSDRAPKPLTASQKKEALIAFALFFPSVPEDQLPKKRLTIRDITRVASLLKEKISAEETIEMLTTFSTSPDGSMGLADFEKMMQAAGML